MKVQCKIPAKAYLNQTVIFVNHFLLKVRLPACSLIEPVPGINRCKQKKEGKKVKIKALALSVLSVALLAGCAGTSTHPVKASNGTTLEVATIFSPLEMNNNRYPDVKLREVSPAHAGAGMGLSLLSAALGGGVGSGDAFDKNSYKGTTIDSMPEPTSRYLSPKAEAKIREWLDKQGGNYVYKQPLYIAAAQWSLVYTDMSAGNSNYDLAYRVLFYKRAEDGNVLSTFVKAECAPTVKTAPLADWRANNYQKVTQETQKMMDACLLELENQLPRLLKK